MSSSPWSDAKSFVNHSKANVLFYQIFAPRSRTRLLSCTPNMRELEMTLLIRGLNGTSALHKFWEQANSKLTPKRFVKNPDICRKLQKADCTTFAAIMCANSSFERLCTVAKWFTWVRVPSRVLKLGWLWFKYFIWDDCMGSRLLCPSAILSWNTYEVFDCGSLTHDQGTIKKYKQTTIEYFKHVLCHEAEYPDLSEYSEELQNALNCWDEIAEHVRQVCSKRTFWAPPQLFFVLYWLSPNQWRAKLC